MESSLEDRYREHREKVQADRLALEKELISCGGEDVLLTKQRRDVLLLQPSDLLLQLRKGELSAVTVLQSYQSKALDLARSFNCITEFIPDAKAWAEALDKLAQDERRALHGLPVSVKDCIMVKGLDCTLGLLKKVGQPAPVDADVVTVLKELGAVPFVKTNASQLCIRIIYFLALAARTLCGALHDIRSTQRGPPAAPLRRRFGVGDRNRPRWEHPPARQLVWSVFGTWGLMGKDGAFVAEATKAIFSAADFHACDPEVPPLSWNDSVYLSKMALRVGWFDSISLFPSTPGVKRAVAQAVAAFEALGHEVVAFPEQNWIEGLDICVQLLFADQGKFVDLLLDGETVDEELLWYKSFAAVPPDQTEDRCPELQRQFGSVAVQHSFFSMMLTAIFNVMDYPAAAVPVTRQTQEEELNIANYSCTDKIHDLIKQNGRDAVGLPLGVQLVALPYGEELLCRAIAELSNSLKYKY
ncbi:hypothetical protein HAZT_HAZT007741 [Hyalella azteca]|uniref:Amidase domain-containing protein n=1 Tax=Hyalella azteca TaxID=294128 RepID=A0A6A0H2S3_HYAAZ|nr:hypothetical protein HAZT_HAZT007741 [Hyalella azteca]